MLLAEVVVDLSYLFLCQLKTIKFNTLHSWSWRRFNFLLKSSFRSVKHLFWLVSCSKSLKSVWFLTFSISLSSSPLSRKLLLTTLNSFITLLRSSRSPLTLIMSRWFLWESKTIFLSIWLKFLMISWWNFWNKRSCSISHTLSLSDLLANLKFSKEFYCLYTLKNLRSNVLFSNDDLWGEKLSSG